MLPAASFDLTIKASADATGSPTSHSIVDKRLVSCLNGVYAPSTNHTIEIRLSKDGDVATRQYTTGESLYVSPWKKEVF